jgi:type I restriction enzyme, S subunit
MTVGLQNLSNQNFYSVRSIVPSIQEQHEIVSHAATSTSTINIAIARTELEIALMQEYRTRLTADIVTGKLDVREAAAQLPEETDEMQLLDDAEALADIENTTNDLAPEESEI